MHQRPVLSGVVEPAYGPAASLGLINQLMTGNPVTARLRQLSPRSCSKFYWSRSNRFTGMLWQNGAHQASFLSFIALLLGGVCGSWIYHGRRDEDPFLCILGNTYEGYDLKAEPFQCIRLIELSHSFKMMASPLDDLN
jgi:hypothetical protein